MGDRGLLGLKSARKCDIYELLDGVAAPLVQLTDDCFSLAISPDLSMVAMGDSRGGINLFDARTGEPIGEPMISELGRAEAMAFNTDGSLLASAHCGEISQENGQETCAAVQIPLWDLLNFQHKEPVFEVLSNADTYPGTIYALAFNPGADKLAFGGDGKMIFQWEIAAGAFVIEIGLPMAGHSEMITALAYGPMESSDLDVLASSSSDYTVIFWNYETSQRLNGALPQSTDTIRSIAFSSDERYLFTGSLDGTLWDIDPQTWIERLCQLAGRNLSETK